MSYSTYTYIYIYIYIYNIYIYIDSFQFSIQSSSHHSCSQGYGSGGFPAWGIPPGATSEFTLECLQAVAAISSVLGWLDLEKPMGNLMEMAIFGYGHGDIYYIYILYYILYIYILYVLYILHYFLNYIILY